MSLFKGIVKLTEEQYLTLKNGETLETDLGSFVFDEDTLYVTENDMTQTRMVIVDALPEKGVENTIYMVPRSGTSTYDRYMLINSRFELIGDTNINLVDYAKKSELPTSLPASDVYAWAKQPTKPSYTINELPSEILTNNKIVESGSNTTTAKLGLSTVRSIGSIAYQALITINDDGSMRISHRNKSVNANADDAYIDLGPNKFRFGSNEVLTTNNGYTKDEVDALLQQLRSLINGQ